MATQPETSPSPFRWAQEFNNNMQQQAARDKASADSMLLSQFVTEARRQAPWSELPVDLAKMNVASDLSLRNSLSVADAVTRRQALAAQAKAMNMAPEDVAKAINDASRMYGEDPDLMLSIADLESRFRNVPNSQGSGAAGVFQFIPSTAKQYGLANPYDIPASADAATRLVRDNRAALQNAGVKEVTPAMIYFAHQQGAGGAAKLLANPNAPAIATLGRRQVLMNGGNAGMTGQQFFDMWSQKFNNVYNQRVAYRNRNKQQQNSYAALLNSPEAARAQAIIDEENAAGNDANGS